MKSKSILYSTEQHLYIIVYITYIFKNTLFLFTINKYNIIKTNKLAKYSFLAMRLAKDSSQHLIVRRFSIEENFR